MYLIDIELLVSAMQQLIQRVVLSRSLLEKIVSVSFHTSCNSLLQMFIHHQLYQISLRVGRGVHEVIGVIAVM